MDDQRFAEIMRESEERHLASRRESDELHAKLKRESDELHAKLKRESDELHRERDERLFSRLERSEQHFIDALAENTAEIKRIGEGVEDARESIRACTRAILSVLDRLDGLEGGSAPA